MQPTEGHSSGKAAIAGHAKAGPKSVVGDDYTIGSRSPFHSKGPLHPAILLVLLLLTVLPGCATRPGPEVLVPQATAPGARLVTLDCSRLPREGARRSVGTACGARSWAVMVTTVGHRAVFQ